MSRLIREMERRRLGLPAPEPKPRKPRRTRAELVAAAGIDPAVYDLHRAHDKQIADARRERRRQVRIARELGQTVPYDLRTLVEDGWNATTIRKVMR